MISWRPQASYPCGNFSVTSRISVQIRKGSIDRAFTASYATDAGGQTSFCSFALRQVSVLSELVLGRLRCILAGAPPQPNSPSSNVTNEPQAKPGPLISLAEQRIEFGCYKADRNLPNTLYLHLRSTIPNWSQAQQGLLAPLKLSTRPFPSLWFREGARRDSKNLINPFMHVQNYWTRHLATLKES